MEKVVANLSGKTRRTKLQGREYIVAPLTLIVPGVLNGSKGPLYYPPEEIAKDPGVWNGVPIVVDHPSFQGQHVSARDPDVLNRQWVGYVFRSKAKGKLTAEGWFDVAATTQVDNRILNAVEHGHKMELSTGLFTDNEPAAEGAVTNDGQPYSFIARNYRPDHLAILPDSIGACSVAEGCGVNVNKADLAKSLEKEMAKSAEAYKQIRNTGGSAMSEFSKEARKKIVDSLVANDNCCWNEADRELLDGFDDGKLGQIQAQDEKDQQREAVVNAAKKGFTDPGGSSHTFNEEKGEWESKIEEPKKEANPVANEKKDKEPEKVLTQEERDKQWMETAPASVVANNKWAEQIIQREKAQLVLQLTANMGDTPDEAAFKQRLQGKPLDELRDLMTLAPTPAEPVAVVPSYLGAAAPAANVKRDFDEDDVLPLPVMNFGEEKKTA